MVFVPLLAGAIKGHTRMLKDARLAESEKAKNLQERRDKAGELLVQLAADGSLAPGAYSAAQAALDKNDFQLTDLVPLIRKVDDVDSTTLLGNVKLPYNFADEEISVAASKGLNSLNSHLLTQSNYDNILTKARNDQSTAEAVLGHIDSYKTRFGQDFYTSNSGKDPVTGAINTPVYTDFSTFARVNQLEEELVNILGQGQQATNARIARDLTKDIAIATNRAGLKPNEFFIKGPSLSVEDPNLPDAFSGGIFTTNETEASDLNALATTLGYDDANIMFADMNTFSKESPELFQQNFLAIRQAAVLNRLGIKSFAQLTGSSDAIAARVSAELGRIGGDTDNIAAQIAAVYPIIARNREGIGLPKGMMSGTISGAQYLEKNALMKPSDIREVHEAASDAETMLEELIKIEGDLGTAGALRSVQSLAAGLYGTGKDIITMFSDSANLRYRDDDASKETLAQIAKEQLGEMTGLDYTNRRLGQAESLMIALAAKMARAVDPAGRLSDQDFRLQFQRLGSTGLLTSSGRKKASLEIVLEEFKEKAASTKMMFDISNKDSLEEEDYIQIEAYRIVEKARKFRKKNNVTTTQQGGGNQNQDPPPPAAETSIPPEVAQALPNATVEPDMLHSPDANDVASQEPHQIRTYGGEFYAMYQDGRIIGPIDNNSIVIIKTGKEGTGDE